VICFALTLFSPRPPAAVGLCRQVRHFRLARRWLAKVEGAGQPGFYLLLLLLVGGINTVISLFYYLRVVKVMTIDEEPRDRPPLAYSDVSLGGAFLWVITLPTALLIVSWSWLSDLSLAAARHLFS
jgi:NADH-quinone oxidoreductase subunit N